LNREKLTYVVLGASGFIGKALLRRLSGKKVIAIGRSEGHDPVGGETYYSTRKYSLEAIALALSTSENIIIDLSYSSVSNASVDDPGKDFADNINLVIDNLKFALAVSTRKYMYVSTGGAIYGSSDESRINEDHPTNPISHYGIIKLASEKYVRMFCPANYLSFNIIRPSNVYGPGQIPFRGQGIVATALGAGIRQTPVTIYGKGDNIRDYIYVDDLCEWLVALCRKGENGMTYNAGSGEGNSILEIITLIKDILAGRQHELLLNYLPDRPFDVKRNILDNTRILNATGIQPAVGLRTGIERSCDWVEEYMLAEKAAAIKII
jgi:UDP-glucose 4-epimerase